MTAFLIMKIITYLTKALRCNEHRSIPKDP
jgi:hypothetical protein